MKRGIEMSWQYDSMDRLFLRIAKKRGKLTLEEVTDLLRYEEGQRYCGHYAIILNCSEETIGGNGLFFEEEQKGDAVDMYQIEDGNTCPVCGKYTPPFEYCPSCGTAWKDSDRNVEKLITAMRTDAEHLIKSENSSQTQDGSLARYWSYIGAVDMAKELGMITDQRRQELYKEAQALKELAQRQMQAPMEQPGQSTAIDTAENGGAVGR